MSVEPENEKSGYLTQEQLCETPIKIENENFTIDSVFSLVMKIKNDTDTEIDFSRPAGFLICDVMMNDEKIASASINRINPKPLTPDNLYPGSCGLYHTLDELNKYVVPRFSEKSMEFIIYTGLKSIQYNGRFEDNDYYIKFSINGGGLSDDVKFKLISQTLKSIV